MVQVAVTPGWLKRHGCRPGFRLVGKGRTCLDLRSLLRFAYTARTKRAQILIQAKAMPSIAIVEDASASPDLTRGTLSGERYHTIQQIRYTTPVNKIKARHLTMQFLDVSFQSDLRLCW